MRILQLCIRFPPAPGGAENHVYNISLELKKRGHKIDVFTSDLYTEVPFVRMKNLEPDYNGIPVRRFKAYSLKGEMHYVFMPKMVRALLSADADIIHTHSYGYFQTTAGPIAKKLRDRPIIVTPHYHPKWSMWGGSKRKGLRRLYDGLLAKPTMRAQDIVICHTQNEKRLLSEYEIPEDRIRIIPAGVDFSKFEYIPSPEPFREQFEISGRMVLYAGRLASNKGLSYLMDAIPQILSEYNDTTFVFIGEDEGQKTHLESRAQELGIRDKIIFTGHLTDERIFLSAFSACDVFVLPSEYEAFGLVLVEAAACEKPTVATRVGGVPEVVEDGKTGLLVDYGDSTQLASAIIDLLGDEKKRKDMGRAGRERVKENFTWPKVVDKLEGVYKEVIA
jgi:glycosyltransferase involved in cell wall biosynthesis